MSRPNGIIQQPPPPPPPPPPPLSDLPCQDLLADMRRRDFIDTCVPLCEALIKANWQTAEQKIERHGYLIRYSINENCETPLHVAASAQSNTDSIEFVRYLVGKMSEADLQLQNRNGNTALSLAAISGNVEIAKIMVTKNRGLPTIPNCEQMMPLYIAVLFGNIEMVDYLYQESLQMNAHGWTSMNRSWVFLKSIEMDFFEFALKILVPHPILAQSGEALCALARKPSAFHERKPHYIRSIVNSTFHLNVEAVDNKAVELLIKIWTSIEEKPKAEIDTILRGPIVLVDGRQTYPSRVLFLAAEAGNTGFLVELIRKYPDLIWKKNENNQSIFHVAVSHRHEVAT
ncbi:hypothetical protein Lser_V15G01873 [Lactuca serriola]